MAPFISQDANVEDVPSSSTHKDSPNNSARTRVPPTFPQTENRDNVAFMTMLNKVCILIVNQIYL